MIEIQQLKISGYKGKGISNLLFTGKRNGKAAIVFPGSGYTCQMPLLYYASSVLAGFGYDVLQVNYQYGKEFASLSENEQEKWFETDAKAVCDALLRHHTYKELALVGKSLGTIAICALLKSGIVSGKKARIVWLTPLLKENLLIENLKLIPEDSKSLFITGDADTRHFDIDTIKMIRKIRSAKVVVIPKANHALEIDTEYNATLKTMKLVLGEISKLLS